MLLLTTVVATTAGSPPAHATPCVPPPTGLAAAEALDSGFLSIAPRRVADTRTGLGGVPVAPLDAGCVLQIDLTPYAPTGATAAVLTITADRTKATTFVTAYACGGSRPGISHLNPRRDDPIPGMAIVPLDATKRACIYADGLTDLIVDLTGWYAPTGDPLHEVAPARVLDTRSAPRPIDLPAGRPADGTVVRVPIGVRGGPIPEQATAVAINLTVTNATTATYATAYPCGTRPDTSTVNTLAGFDRGAPAMIGLDASGALCVFVERSADLIVDITGWFGPDDTVATTVTQGSTVREFAARRLVDSRSGIGGWTGPLLPGDTAGRRINLLDAIPIGVTAVQLEVIAANPQAPGYLTVFPCSSAVPTVSAVNFRPGQPESALVTVGLINQSTTLGTGVLADICVYSSAATDVVVDVLTVFGAKSALRSFTTSPKLDRQPLPGQPDHTVHCPVGGGPVTIDAAAAPGGVVSINQGTAFPHLNRTLTMQPDEVATVDVAYPGGVQHTYLRCLPNDFPALVGVGKSPSPGWIRATTAAAASFAFILDEYGVPVWYKRTPYPVIGLWDTGHDLAWRRWTGGGFPTEVPPLGYELRSLSGELTGTIEIPGEAIDWHELLTLPNGNHLVVTYPRRDLPLATKLACTDPTGVKRTTNVMVDSDIVELDANGGEVWRWRSADHILASETLLPICFPLVGGVFGLDLAHVNAVDLFSNGDLLVTARHLNAVLRIERATGTVLWKLGGTAQTEGTALTIVADARGGPRGPHDGRVLPNGNVTIHDNHVGAADATSRAVEYAVDPGAATASLVWTYSAGTLKSGTLGSVRRLADGTTLIGWGTGSSPWIEQVSAEGNRILTVSAGAADVIYRAEPAPAAAYNRDALRNAAGGTAPPAP